VYDEGLRETLEVEIEAAITTAERKLQELEAGRVDAALETIAAATISTRLPIPYSLMQCLGQQPSQSQAR